MGWEVGEVFVVYSHEDLCLMSKLTWSALLASVAFMEMFVDPRVSRQVMSETIATEKPIVETGRAVEQSGSHVMLRCVV